MNQSLALDDEDPSETCEWLDALESVVQREGAARADYLLYRQLKQVEAWGLRGAPKAERRSLNTPYTNSLGTSTTLAPGVNWALEQRIEALVRWNAMAMVQRVNRHDPALGGHVASFASAATLYEVGFNHFFKGSGADGGDLVFIQGHSSPGIYARAFLEGRLDEAALDRFRQEVQGGGLSSYPHPWLMPEFWQFPTVSMGLGAVQAIHQAFKLEVPSQL